MLMFARFSNWLLLFAHEFTLTCISLQRAKVGKTAVARWDSRQKELKARQQQEQLLQQQLPASTPGNEQKYSYADVRTLILHQLALFAR